jgi:hypothetical protein
VERGSRQGQHRSLVAPGRAGGRAMSPPKYFRKKF